MPEHYQQVSADLRPPAAGICRSELIFMKLNFKPKSELEKFGIKIYFLLVENFPQTFFVGGAVRDKLLGKKITDIDIATSATPQEVVSILKDHYVDLNIGYQKFGVIVALSLPCRIAITTFRKDLPADSRYPVVTYTKDPKIDAQRRDFTINALYLSLKTGKILDFYKGLQDVKKHLIRFIGNPAKRIEEDPLRIIRALRFALVNSLTIEKKSYAAIKKYFPLAKKITKSKLETEFKKINSEKNKKIMEQVINNPETLDKYFLKS
jgi:poly(A) polymerase